MTWCFGTFLLGPAGAPFLWQLHIKLTKSAEFPLRARVLAVSSDASRVLDWHGSMAEGAAGIHNNLEALRDRKGVSVLELWELFPDDDHAEAWLCWARWGGMKAQRQVVGVSAVACQSGCLLSCLRGAGRKGCCFTENLIKSLQI